MTRNALAWRLAWRELRGGVRGFRVFIACLVLGVAAIAGVGSISESIHAGIKADARKLLGGDVDLLLTHREADADQRAWLAANTERVSEVAEMRAMARRPDGATRSLVELKAVDGRFPLFGGLRLRSGQPLGAALAQRNGAWGVAAEQRLLDKLSVKVGDRLRLGDVEVAITDVIAEEADRGAGALNFGPRLLASLAALHATGLVQPGSLVRYHYRLDIPDDTGVDAWVKRLDARFPDAGWRVRSIDNAAPNIQRFVDRANLFLSLVGLTALLVGGVGVGNAVRSYLESRIGTIAILKCLGGSGPLIFRIYLTQVLILAVFAIAIGVLVGALAPVAAAPLLAERLPVAARIGIYVTPLALAALFGLLITLAFSLWPLAQAREVSPANLFRAVILPPDNRPRAIYLAALAAVLVILATLAVATAHMPKMAGWFVLGAIVAFAAFHGAARLIIALIRRLPRQKSPVVRLALANLSRPGAPTSSVVLSLGLGLTVLAAVALIEGNLSRQITERLPAEAPEFYFIDIQGNQLAEFETIAKAIPGVGAIESVPMLRGRITRINGTPTRDVKPPPEFAWILRGDRGLTWARHAPVHGSEVIAGKWWAPDYSGPPLVSFDARAAEAFGLKIGDTITIDLLGREITATVANLRAIDWTTLSINFVMIFSPGLLEHAPQVYVATARTEPRADAALERAVTDRFPNISAIRVKEVLQGIADILERLAGMVRLIASVAVAAGALVLAGAVAATHRRRIHDAVLLKVLGATRKKVLATYLVEFGVLGLVTAAVASVIGSVAAWAVVTYVMHASWSFIPAAVAATVALCVAITLVAGFAGTWRALGHKAAPVLRNE
jgi:putative ABC transport system permease protein